MIDTCYIYYQFESYDEYNNAIALLTDYIKVNANKAIDTLYVDSKRKHSVVTHALAKKGFQEIRFRSLYDNGYYAIEILLRPKLLVDKNNYINVLYEYEVEDARKKFNKILQEKVGLDVPDMFEWKVRRIDYAIDLNVKQELIPIYIKLFKHGNIPHYALENKVTQRWFDQTNNLYLVNKNYAVNFYDRYTTLQKKQTEYKKKFMDIEKAKNLLRLEIQLTVDAYKMKGRGLITKNRFGQFLKQELCKTYIMQHFDTIIGAGDYYHIDKAKEISKTDSQRRILELISGEGSIYGAKELYLSNRGETKRISDRFSKLINNLRRKGINPVTIPDYYDTDRIKGLRPKIEEYFNQDRYIRIRRRKRL